MQDVDYRKSLRLNLAALLTEHGDTTTTLARKAVYLDGTKRGKRVAERSLRYFMEQDGPSPGLDALAAIASAYGIAVWQLLAPGLTPDDLPRLALTPSERRLRDEFASLKARLIDHTEGDPDADASGSSIAGRRRPRGRGDGVPG